MANVTKAELAKMLEECKELSNQRENEINTLKCVIDKVESEKVALELKLSDLSDVDELRHQYQRVSSELVSAKTELTSKENELKELTASYNDLQTELKALQEQFVKDKDECLNHIYILESEMKKSIRKELTATINELNNELEEAKTKFKVAAVLAISVTLSFITYAVVF